MKKNQPYNQNCIEDIWKLNVTIRSNKVDIIRLDPRNSHDFKTCLLGLDEPMFI